MSSKSKSRRWANRSPKRPSASGSSSPATRSQLDEPIASLETDKVAVEVPSPVCGRDGRADGRRRRHGRRSARCSRRSRTTVGGGRRRRSRRAPRRPLRARPGLAGRPGARASRARSRSTPASAVAAVRRAVLEHGIDPATHQGHRQGRPPDQGRRARRGAEAKAGTRARRPRRLPRRLPRTGCRQPASAARSASR